jgi:uncharacterized integral membrane protein
MRTVGKIIASLAFVAIAAVVVMFALANRTEVPVSLWPLPFSIGLRLSVAVLGALAIGIVLGGAISWASGAGRRRRPRTTPTPSPDKSPPVDPAAARPAATELKRLPAAADRD